MLHGAIWCTPSSCAAVQDQYLEISSAIPSSAQLFGLGEHTSELGFPLRRDGIPYVLWARDQPPTQANANLYGCHPFILDVRPGAARPRQPVLPVFFHQGCCQATLGMMYEEARSACGTSEGGTLSA